MKYFICIVMSQVVILMASCSEKKKRPFLQHQEITIYAVGDIMLGDAAQPLLDRYGYDYPFKGVRQLFRGRDILVGNLEVPITEHTVPYSLQKKYIYKAHEESMAALKRMEFNLLCLGNNHILDYGEQGLRDTIKVCQKYDMDFFGVGVNQQEALSGKVITVKGLRIGFISYMQHYHNYDVKYPFYAGFRKSGVLRLDDKNLEAGIKDLQARSDFIIVSMHWGENYQKINSIQKYWAKKAVALGADLILGHHPHVVQGVDIIQGVPVIYSLGNYTFGTRGRFRHIPKEYHYGWVAEIKIENNQYGKLSLVPIKTNNRKIHYQPVVENAVYYKSIAQEVFSDCNARYAIRENEIEILL